MNLFDIRTLIFSQVITNAICLTVIAFLWVQNRNHFAGLGLWLANFVIQTIGILLIALRGMIPDFLSIVVSTSLIIVGGILLYMGLELFVDKRTPQVHNYLLLVVFMFTCSFFTFIVPSVLMRTVTLAVGIILLCLQCAWLLLHRADLDLRPITRGAGYIFLTVCLFATGHILVDLAANPGDDFFQSDIFKLPVILIDQLLIVILTFGLVLMVNRRLIRELERDLLQRKQVEQALKLSEEKLNKVFHVCPDGVLISKPEDGQLAEASDGFFPLSGYSVEETPADYYTDPNICVKPQDREVCMTALREKLGVHDHKYDFYVKPGRVLNHLHSGEIPQLGHEAYGLPVSRDVTEYKRTEEYLRESERGYQSLLENMPGGYAYYKVMYESGQPQDFIYLQVNSAFEKLTGLKDVVGKRISETLPATYSLSPKLFEIYGRTSTTGKPEQVEMYMDALDCWFSIYAYSPEPEHLVTILEDVTKHKLLEASFHHRNDVLEASHQVMLDLVNRHDMDDILQTLLVKIGALLNVSDVSIDLVENSDTLVTYTATPGYPLTMGNSVRHGEAGWLGWQAVETGQPVILEDYSTWSRHHEVCEGFPIHAIAIIPIRHQDRVIGTINILRPEGNKPFSDTDIYVAKQVAQMVALVMNNAELYSQLQSELADRKQVDENLRESRENFQRYFNMSTVGMCVTSSDRRWIEANGRLRQMLGYSDEELASRTWNEISHPDDRDSESELYNQILVNQRDSYQVDQRFIRKDGSIIYATLFVTCHRNPDGTVRYLLASLIDITDRKQGEESLLKLAAIEERQRLARDLHDSVNQSIHGLVLFSETLVSTLEKNNITRARQIADRLQESARQALKETRLMLYEMQSAGIERSVNLIPDLETRLATVERRAGVKAQIIQEGSIVYCPKAWHQNLFWITIEALNNALKHAQARNMQIKICGSPTHLQLEIIDDGIGFDSDQPRAGGLGLQNMHDRARLIGGELAIFSTHQKGSCVRFKAEIKK